MFSLNISFGRHKLIIVAERGSEYYVQVVKPLKPCQVVTICVIQLLHSRSQSLNNWTISGNIPVRLLLTVKHKNRHDKTWDFQKNKTRPH